MLGCLANSFFVHVLSVSILVVERPQMPIIGEHRVSGGTDVEVSSNSTHHARGPLFGDGQV